MIEFPSSRFNEFVKFFKLHIKERFCFFDTAKVENFLLLRKNNRKISVDFRFL